MERQYCELEPDLNIKLESPRPQSSIRLGQNGIEMTIRYPADARRAVQVADEISRRVLDAIAREPALTLAVPGTANLVPASAPVSMETGDSAELNRVEDGRLGFAAATEPAPETSVKGFSTEDLTNNGSEAEDRG